MALPKNTSSIQRGLAVTIPLVVSRYLEGAGEAPPFIRGVLRRCHWCDTDSCIFVPDSTGDWWYRCTTCSRCWNLFEDLRRRNGFSVADATDWLTQNHVMEGEGARMYAEVSEKKRAILDWFSQHRAESIKSGDAHRVIPGEWARCRLSQAFEFLRENGLHNPAPGRWSIYGWIFMHRTIDGIPCKIGLSQQASNIGHELDLSLCPNSQVGYFIDGIINGDSVYVVTSERLRDLDKIPLERPLFVVTTRGRWSSCFSPPPVWRNVTVLSETRTLGADLIKNASLLGTGSLVKIDNTIMDIDDAMIDRAWWPGITGFALKSGAISGDATLRIAEAVAMKRGDSVKSVLGAIRRNSDLITEKFSSAGMTIIPDGMATKSSTATLDGRRVRLRRAPARLCNFQLFRLPPQGQGVTFSLIVGDKRAELNVSDEIASDSNLLITELHAVARENNMGGLVVYRQPPYPKDLLTNERK